MAGFIRAETRPTKIWSFVRLWFSAWKRWVSASSLPKARTTRTPVRFSLVADRTLSSFPWTCWYRGMVHSITPKTTAASRGMATTNTRAAFQSMVKAMTMAPNTTKGERSSRRRARFMPFCTWLMSLVMRVMRVAVPVVSSSV